MIFKISVHDIRAAQTSLLDASVSYGAKMPSKSKKIVLGLKKCTQQSLQQLGYIRSARMASKQLHNMSIIAFHCDTTSCPESPDPSSPRLLQKRTRLIHTYVCVCVKAVHVYMCIDWVWCGTCSTTSPEWLICLTR